MIFPRVSMRRPSREQTLVTALRYTPHHRRAEAKHPFQVQELEIRARARVRASRSRERRHRRLARKKATWLVETSLGVVREDRLSEGADDGHDDVCDVVSSLATAPVGLQMSPRRCNPLPSAGHIAEASEDSWVEEGLGLYFPT